MAVLEIDILSSSLQNSGKGISLEKPVVQETLTAVDGNNHIGTNGDNKEGIYILKQKFQSLKQN